MVYDSKAVEVNIKSPTISESGPYIALYAHATTESFRVPGHENLEGKALCRDLNTNLNKLIRAKGKHLGNNVLSD